MPSTHRRVAGNIYTVSFKFPAVNYVNATTYKMAPGSHTAQTVAPWPAIPWPGHRLVGIKVRLSNTAIAAGSQLVVRAQRDGVSVGTGITLTPASAVDTTFSATESVDWTENQTLMVAVLSNGGSNAGSVDVHVSLTFQVIS